MKPSHSANGGACDHWDNLSQETKDRYNLDESCVKRAELCEWGQDVEDICTGRYWYWDPNTMTDKQHMSCNDDLVWCPITETCRDCKNVESCKC